MNDQITTYFISILILFSHIGLIITLLFYLFFRQKCHWFFNWLRNNGILLAFITALFSMLGSLYYSDIVRLEPCLLCWYQRIFMYPLVFILGMSLFKKKDKNIISYSILLSSVGALFAIYHIYLQFFQEKVVTCSPFENSVSCSETYFVMFNYISFPVMSFTAFLLIIILLMFSNKRYV